MIKTKKRDRMDVYDNDDDVDEIDIIDANGDVDNKVVDDNNVNSIKRNLKNKNKIKKFDKIIHNDDRQQNDTRKKATEPSLTTSKQLPQSSSSKKLSLSLSKKLLSSSSSSSSSSNQSSVPLKSNWNFTTDYNDHFETPKIAYTDLLPLLQTLATNIHKKIHEIIIYDPYYCNGMMKTYLNELG